MAEAPVVPGRHASRRRIKQMIWLSTASLVAGGLLAQRFRFMVLAPATFVVVVVAIAVGVAQTSSVWSTIWMIATASVGIQIGYFLGMLIHYALGALLARRSAVLSSTPQGAVRHKAAVAD